MSIETGKTKKKIDTKFIGDNEVKVSESLMIQIIQNFMDEEFTHEAPRVVSVDLDMTSTESFKRFIIKTTDSEGPEV